MSTRLPTPDGAPNRHDQMTRRRTVATVLAVLVVIAAMAGALIYGLNATNHSAKVDHPARPGATSPDGQVTSGPQATTGSAGPGWTRLPQLPHTQNPIGYARAVATAVFGWDTTSGLTTTDYAQVLVVDADPSGTETNGLVTDLGAYLPDEQAWAQLREYGTTQKITVSKAYVPKSWDTAKTQGAGQIAEGTVAVTIEGTRHRKGEWLGKPQRTRHSVSLTVFVACPPAFERCHVLRLSQLDNPLR